MDWRFRELIPEIKVSKNSRDSGEIFSEGTVLSSKIPHTSAARICEGHTARGAMFTKRNYNLVTKFTKSKRLVSTNDEVFPCFKILWIFWLREYWNGLDSTTTNIFHQRTNRPVDASPINVGDNTVVSVAISPLVLKCRNSGEVIWLNRKPNSPNYCKVFESNMQKKPRSSWNEIQDWRIKPSNVGGSTLQAIECL